MPFVPLSPILNCGIRATYSLSFIHIVFFLWIKISTAEIYRPTSFFTTTLITLYSQHTVYQRIIESAEGEMWKTECSIIYVAITVYAVIPSEVAAGRGVECGLSGGGWKLRRSCGGVVQDRGRWSSSARCSLRAALTVWHAAQQRREEWEETLRAVVGVPLKADEWYGLCRGEGRGQGGERRPRKTEPPLRFYCF